MPHLATQPSRLGSCVEPPGDSLPAPAKTHWIVLVVADVVRQGDVGQGSVLSRKLVIAPASGGWVVPALPARPVVRLPLDEGLGHAPMDQTTAFER
jgi:hypothetical protein